MTGVVGGGNFAGFDDPSGVVGLNMSPGTSVTALRSDSAPALDRSYSVQTVTVGFNFQIADTTTRQLMIAAGLLLTGTLNMPQAPQDGQEVSISFNQAITTLSLLPGAGQSIIGALLSAVLGGFARYMYRASTTTWHRTG